MKTAVILDAGRGTKLWPYAQIRSKGLLPIGGAPLLAHQVAVLQNLGYQKIVVVAGAHTGDVRALFRRQASVQVVTDANPQGSARSLLLARNAVQAEMFLLLYSDVVMHADDLRRLDAAQGYAALLAPLNGKIVHSSTDHIVCEIEKGNVTNILGHPRDAGTHYFAAFRCQADVFCALENTPTHFSNVEVGQMPPPESFFEMTLAQLIADNTPVCALEAQNHVVDIDKPWQILEANRVLNTWLCADLRRTHLADGASIHPSAVVGGFVQLGEGSSIGFNCILDGNIIVGKRTKIENGAIIKGNVVIGDDCTICNGCLIEEYATVGDNCYVGHGAELNGILLRNAFLYHYMEIYGIVGENVDLGAATVCGTLRFDDGATCQRVKGRRETPHPASDAVFFGDYSRTGVNAILMPGVKTGVYSIVGAGVRLLHDLEDHALIYAEQTQVKKAWGSEKYGW
ncbi:MAG: NDP-sugar synthase [Oscillospiraceae bacterium]|jgi:bifunctional UDP-N-acetylglucosamine pyrophosphorylase/glucosamine-1-phosphate N-acetyltransferase|nr:NDP-sugar synthase [Oscillospiraceae bacterium]